VRVQASSSGGYYHSCHNGAHLSKARKAELEAVCEHIAQPGKGITACDEGPGTIGDRFAKYGIENSEEVSACCTSSSSSGSNSTRVNGAAGCYGLMQLVWCLEQRGGKGRL
jgi:hypothetical protein